MSVKYQIAENTFLGNIYVNDVLCPEIIPLFFMYYTMVVLGNLEKFKLMYLLYQNHSLFCFTFYDGSFAFSHFLTRKQLLWFY